MYFRKKPGVALIGVGALIRVNTVYANNVHMNRTVDNMTTLYYPMSSLRTWLAMGTIKILNFAVNILKFEYDFPK